MFIFFGEGVNSHKEVGGSGGRQFTLTHSKKKMKKWNVCGFAAAGLLLSVLATAELVSVMKSGGTDLTDEIKFFELHDTNFDSFHSKKEFYYAIMQDSFDLLARKYNKSSVDMKFELSDLNGDKKISVDEWKNVLLQGSEALQDVQYVEPSTAEEEAKPTVSPSLPASQAFSGVASGKGPRGKMHIEAEVILIDGRKAYLSDNATWHETNLFCEEQGVRLCFENELCSLNSSKGINQEDALPLEHREKRWAPLAGIQAKPGCQHFVQQMLNEGVLCFIMMSKTIDF